MNCWSCYWGWPVAVAEIYKRALRDLDYDDIPLEYGPGHIVWGDENFDSAEWCLEHFDEYSRDLTDKQAAIVRRSLQELVAIPEDERDAEPEDYDGENPENFPPTVPVEKVR